MCLVLALLGLFAVVRYRLMPTAEALVCAQVENSTSDQINQAVEEKMEAEAIFYDRLITLEKNLDGQITALKTDMSEVNRLKAEILNSLGQQIQDLTVEQLSVPLGNLLLPEIFSGRGPILPVRIVAVKTMNADFGNVFSQAGINQTFHQITLTISVQVTVLMPGQTLIVPVTSEVVVAQTVIVGVVPETVISIPGEENGTKG